jgi:hypothetical protein
MDTDLQHSTGRALGASFAACSGQRNRRLASFSFRLLNETCDNGADCAHKCAQTNVPKTENKLTTEGARVVALSVKGDGLNEGRLHVLAIQRSV